MKNINIICERQYDGGYGFGIAVMIHNHNEQCWHFHLLLDIILWFVELRIGRDEL